MCLLIDSLINHLIVLALVVFNGHVLGFFIQRTWMYVKRVLKRQQTVYFDILEKRIWSTGTTGYWLFLWIFRVIKLLSMWPFLVFPSHLLPSFYEISPAAAAFPHNLDHLKLVPVVEDEQKAKISQVPIAFCFCLFPFVFVTSDKRRMRWGRHTQAQISHSEPGLLKIWRKLNRNDQTLSNPG